MNEVRAALLIAAKDVRERVRDRSALLIALVVPLALAALFALALRDVSGGDVTFDYAVVNEDRGRAGRVFSERVLGRLEREGVAALRRASSLEDGRRLAETGSVAARLRPAGRINAAPGVTTRPAVPAASSVWSWIAPPETVVVPV